MAMLGSNTDRTTGTGSPCSGRRRRRTTQTTTVMDSGVGWNVGSGVTATPAEIAILPVLGQTEAVRGGSWCVEKIISPVNPSRMRVQRDFNTNGSHGVPKSPTLVAAWAVLLSHFETLP